MDPTNEKQLISILDRTINFVKFAEAKNGAVVALSAALIAGTLKALSATNIASQFAFALAIISLTIAAIISIKSFKPILSVDKERVSKYPDHKEPNPLFFGHTAKLTPEDYLKELYRDGNNKFDHIELLYADQIVINSYCTLVKLSHFDKAAIAMIIGFILIGFGEISILIC